MVVGVGTPFVVEDDGCWLEAKEEAENMGEFGHGDFEVILTLRPDSKQLEHKQDVQE